MGKIIVGKTAISYDVRESSKAKAKKIVVTPDQVEVVVPQGTPERSTEEFVEQKKNKVFITQHEVNEKARQIKNNSPTHYITGAKIKYRGRMMRLFAQKESVDSIRVKYKSGFYVSIPMNKDYNDIDIKIAIDAWMKDHIKKDAEEFVKHYGKKLILFPKRIRIKEQKNLWGSCGKDMIININWKLIQFPKQILEYVVVHEICHLKYRNHSNKFWSLLGSVMPEYQTCKKWLDEKGDYNL